MTPLQICFVAPNALPVIDPAVPGPIGGIETRSWLFARTLAKRTDVDMNFVVRDAVRPRQQVIESVRIQALVEPLASIRQSIGAFVARQPAFPWIGLRRWSWNLLWQIPLLAAAKLSPYPHGLSGGPDPFLRDLETDVFCTFGVNPASASAVATAHERKLPAVLVLGSDGDLDARFLEGASYANQYGDRGDMSLRLLQAADTIVVQTPQQQQLLKERFGRDGILVPNPIHVEEWDQQLTMPPPFSLPAERYVLWIGRADYAPKQPLKAYDIARQLPETHFVMVVNPYDRDVEETLQQTRPANVTLVPRVLPSQIASLYARASALLNTSSFEGFPNTFLQAVLSRIPIISLSVDPRLRAELPLAECMEGSIDSAVGRLHEIAEQGTAGKSAALRPIVIAEHDASQCAERLLNVLRQVTPSIRL